jgi:hydroxyacyl-ACP dehydratase HTD2-like protein with hotdog domain
VFLIFSRGEHLNSVKVDSMAYTCRRFLSTTPRLLNSATAEEACTEILTRFNNKPVSIRKQLFDSNQLHLLNLSLNRTTISNDAPPDGTPIPPGYHLVYFTPSIVEAELGLDGTDRTVNPLRPFTRRMWAGGELEWTRDPSSLLRVGQVVQETTRMRSAEAKMLKSGGEMLVVGVEKTFENQNGVALIDRRNWVFQKEIGLGEGKAPPPKPEEKDFPRGDCTRDFLQTPVSLFRFSALTFNAHKIHYSPEWCRAVEGHRDAVVHGPLNLINMLDLWRDSEKEGDAEGVPKSISYRAMSPLYVGEKYRIVLAKNKGDWKADIWDSYGKLAMKGTIQE